MSFPRVQLPAVKRTAAGSPVSTPPSRTSHKLPALGKDAANTTGSDGTLFQVVNEIDYGPSLSPKAPGTPLQVESLNSTMIASDIRQSDSLNGTYVNDSSLSESKDRSFSGSTLSAPKPKDTDITAEGASRVRREIDSMRKELKQLEEIEEREREAKRLKERKDMQERRKREKEEEEKRAVEMAELRKFQDEARAERLAREAEEQSKLEEERRRKEWEQGTLPQSVKPILKSMPSPMNNLEEFNRANAGLKKQIKALHGEMLELQDNNWARIEKSKMRAKALEEKASRIANVEFDEPDEDAAAFNRSKSYLRSEISSIHSELHNLERQDKLSTMRQQAREDHVREMMDNESEKQVAYMEAVRSKAQKASQREDAIAQKLREQQEAEMAALAELKERERIALIARKDSSNKSSQQKQLDRHSEDRKRMPQHQKALEASLATETSNKATDSAIQALSDEERKGLDQEDAAAQRERQRRDLRRLREEHEGLLREGEQAKEKVQAEELDVKLRQDAEITKAILMNKRAPGQTLQEMYSHASAEDLPEISHYRPKSLPSSAYPATLSGTSPDELAEKQLENEEVVAEINDTFEAEQKRTKQMFDKREKDQQHSDDYFKMKEAERHAKFQAKEAEAQKHVLEEQKGFLGKLQSRLQELEDEEAQLKEKKEQEEKDRVARMEEELRREKALRQAETQQRDWDNGVARDVYNNLDRDYQRALQRVKELELEKAVDDTRAARAKELQRWSPSIEEHPEFKTQKRTKPKASRSQPESPTESTASPVSPPEPEPVPEPVPDVDAAAMEEGVREKERNDAAAKIQGLHKMKEAREVKATKAAEREVKSREKEANLPNKSVPQSIPKGTTETDASEEGLPNLATLTEVSHVSEDTKPDHLEMLLQSRDGQRGSTMDSGPHIIFRDNNADDDLFHARGTTSSGSGYTATEESSEPMRPDSSGFDGMVPITELPEGEWNQWLENHQNESTATNRTSRGQSSIEALIPHTGHSTADASEGSRPDSIEVFQALQIDAAEERIGMLEDQITKLKSSIGHATLDTEARDRELDNLRLEKDAHTRQIESLNELLNSHANIIRELQKQTVDMTPKLDRAAEDPAFKKFLEEEVIREKRERAATKIQSLFRGYKTRKYLKVIRENERQKHLRDLENEAASIIQGFFKYVLAKKELERRRLAKERKADPNLVSPNPSRERTVSPGWKRSIRDKYHGVIAFEAAVLIQSVWWGYLARKRIDEIRASKGLPPLKRLGCVSSKAPKKARGQ